MSWTMNADDSGGAYEQPPPGPQAAVLTRIIDIGTHTDNSPQYGEQRRHRVIFMWELAELMSDDRPYTCQAFYTLSMHEKANLRLMLESWRGKAFEVNETVEIDVALGKPCLINVGETASGKAKVLSVSRIPKGMTPPTAQGPLVLFRTDQPDWSVFEQLSSYHQKQIETSEEWAGMKSHHEMQQGAAATENTGPGHDEPDFDDDIPF